MLATVISFFPTLAFASEGAEGNLPIVFAFIAVIWGISGFSTAKDPIKGLMSVGLFGMGVSMYLGFQHFVEGPSLCDAGATFSCSTVNQSVYSEIAGVPIAMIGFANYFVTMILAFQSRQEKYQSVGALLTLTYGFSLLYSMVLAYLSSVEIGAWCLFCISLYGLNAIGLWGALSLKKRLPDVGPFAGASLGTAIFTFVFGIIFGNAMMPKAEMGATTENINIMDVVEKLEMDLPLDGSEPVLGNAKGTIQLVEFADFECPHCAKAAPELKDLIANNNHVSLKFKHYPISNQCNPNIQHEGHANACQAAYATDCAGQQGLFWELSRLVFKNQKYLSAKDLEFLAEQVGVDMPKFKACLQDEKIKAGVTSDINAADVIGLTGTPSVYVKGIGDQKSWYRLVGTMGQLDKALQALNPKQSSEPKGSQ